MLVAPPFVKIKRYNEDLIRKFLENHILDKVEGQDIYIPESSNLPMSIIPKANTKQDSREGYNLLDVKKSYLSSDNGLTSKYNKDGSLTTSGIPTSNYVSVVKASDITDILKDGETYTIWQEKTGNVLYLQIDIINKTTNEVSYVALNSNTTNLRTFTANKNIYDYKIKVQSHNMTVWGEESRTITNKYMLLEGEYTVETIPPFEQYGATPSLKFPSPIEYAGGEFESYNLLDFRNAKGGNADGITCTVLKDGTYTFEGIATDNVIRVWLLGSYSNTIPIFTLEAGTYYIKDIILYNKTTQSTPSIGGIITLNSTLEVTAVRSINATMGETYNKICYPIIVKVDDSNNFTPPPYLPYGTITNEYEIETNNGNLLEPILSTTTFNGITCTNNGDGTFTLDGTCIASSNATFRLDQKTRIGIENLKNYDDIYTLSIGNSHSGISINLMDYPNYTAFIATTNITTKSLSNVKNAFIYLRVEQGTTLENFVIKPMLLKGEYTEETLPPFVKYQSQTYNFKCPYKLAKCGDKKDHFNVQYVEKGGYKKIIKVEHVEETYLEKINSMNGVSNTIDGNKKRFLKRLKYNSSQCDLTHNIAYCDKYKLIKQGGTNELIEGFTITGTTVSDLYVYDNNYSDQSQFNNNQQDLLNAYNEFLNNNPLYVLYQLETPIVTDITSNTEFVEQMEALLNANSFEGETYISFTSNIEEKGNLILSAEYFKSYKTKFKELETKVDKLEALIFES